MYRPRARAGSRDVTLEFSLPLSLAGSASSEQPGECSICASRFCPRDECCTSLTHLQCCTQPLCVRCVGKLARACTCSDDCDKVICICPYCREISGVSCRELFLGACKSACADCADAPPPAAAAPPA
jgi:hypothetical protein